MAKRITSKEVIQPDIFKDSRESGEALLKVIKDIEKSFKDLGKEAEKTSKETTFDDVAKIEKLQNAYNKTTKAKRELNSIQKEENKLKLKLESLKKGELDSTIKLKEEIKKENAERRKTQKSLIETTNAYKKLTDETNKAQAEFKRLAAQYGITDKRTQSALNKFNKLDDSLRAINNAAKDGRRDVGRYGTALDGAGKGALNLGKNLIGALGVVGGIQMFVQVVTDAFNIVREFASAQSELAAILGTSKSEITSLTELTKELGATTSFSATEVTKAATELAKLGLNTDQIEGSLKGVLDGAVALGSEIPETAALVGASLKSFNLDASESERVVSTLAVASTKSALDFNKLQTSLSNVAPAAAAFGSSIEETTALLGLVVDKGIDASTAGSQLRNIFITLRKEGLTLEDGLSQIANSQDKLSTANQLFGKQAAVTAIALADQKDKIKDATLAITGQDEALKALIEERLDNLDGDLKILSSSWEGLILSFEDGEGILNSIFRGAVQFATIILSAFTTTNKILSIFFDKLEKEFSPLIDAVKELFGSFGDFNFQGAITEIIIQRLVVGFKVLLLPIRLLFQTVLTLKDAFILVTNEGKRLLNFLGADFKIDPTVNVDNVINRFKKIKDIVIDTFTVDEIPAPDIKKPTTEQKSSYQKLGEEIGKVIKEGVRKPLEEIRLIDTSNNRFKKAKEKELEDFKNREIKRLETVENNTESIEDAVDREINKYKERAEAIRKMTELVTSYFIKESKKREESLNNEFAANEDRQSKLQELADNGNAKAIESLDELNKRQAEIEREKLAEQRKQRAAELINTGIQTYTAKVQNNDPNPVGSTLTDIALLRAGLEALTGFYTGTEKNVESDLGSPSLNTSKDAYLGITKSKKLFRFDGKEKIFNPKQSAILDKYGMSNTDVVNMVERFANMDLNKKVDSLNKPYQSNSEIIRKFDEVVKAVNNQKHETTNFNYDNFMKAFIESKRSGNKVVKRIRKTSF